GAEAASLVGRSVTVEAPATIANLGAGYDCLGLAVDLQLKVMVQAVEAPSDPAWIDLTIHGDCVGELPEDRSNRFIVALEAGLWELGFDRLDEIGLRGGTCNTHPPGAEG